MVYIRDVPDTDLEGHPDNLKARYRISGRIFCSEFKGLPKHEITKKPDLRNVSNLLM
jgi:hypothetical protein